MKLYKEKKQKIILILLDACRGDYLNSVSTPFLMSLAKKSKHYERLCPSFGFCERTEILTGLNSVKSKCFTAFGYDPSASPYKKYRRVLKLLGSLERVVNSALFSKIIRRVIWIYFRSKADTFYPARIPLEELSYFALTEDGVLNHINKSEHSIYNKCKAPFFDATTSLNQYLSGTDQDRLDRVLSALNASYDFFPTYISLLDGVGHAFGPASPQLSEALRVVDSQIEKFHRRLRTEHPEAVLVICGDHGMSPVHDRIDVSLVIKYLKNENPNYRDITYFIDSTMVRFWSNRADFNFIELERLLNESFKGYGRVVKSSEFEHHGIPQSDLYGELIWICNDGVLISPDFFTPEGKHINGMHGYVPTGPAHYGFCLVEDPKSPPSVVRSLQPLTDVYDELKKYFD